MAFFVWKNDFNVNISTIDKQHKELVGMVNALFDAMKQGKGSLFLAPLLDGLVSYAKTHFQTEERLMKTHSYPGYEAHRQEHEAFTTKVLDVQTRFKNGSVALSVEVGQFLKEWLTKHILGTDKAYGPFLNERGVS